jgi:hypothetical protein
VVKKDFFNIAKNREGSENYLSNYCFIIIRDNFLI